MINIKNTQRKIFFCTTPYLKKAQAILHHLNYSAFDLGIWLTTDKTIQKYNKKFRNKDKPTDVLSFPYHDNAQPGKKIVATEPDDKNLGDIIISVPYVYTNKHNLPGTFEQRMDRMLVHGICHLLGYDHIEDNDFEQMIDLENKLLKLISNVGI